ncbi:LysR substrate-binding domain-containing protein [Undibacterium arcticum]|uniref:LysR substrate-binding domain-containing protein n=1 Tax=Undibacterium arcticum TaxID=1762892 RepID=UPI00362258C3
MKLDLNDLYFYVQVVDRNGFTAAAQALGVPKSRLSRRIAELEKSLGVRLLHRTSRRIAVTDIGAEFYRHCAAMITEAHAAEDAVHRTLAEPVGTINISAPGAMGELVLGELLPRFMTTYPKVRVVTQITNRRVDLVDERIDVALRITAEELESSSLVQSNLCSVPWVLLASPSFLKRVGQPQGAAGLAAFDALVFGVDEEPPVWRLLNQAGEQHVIALQARMRSDNMVVLKAALAGIGVVALPIHVCAEELAQGTLHRVLPDWQPPAGQVRIVFPTRRGVVPAVRAYIDFLKAELPAAIERQYGSAIEPVASGG